MKQFSVKEYLANPSRKVVTRDGRPVRVLCTDKKSEYSVVALVSQNENTETTYNFAKDGTYLKGEENSLDLFFGPLKKMAWANLYSTQLGTTFSGDFYKTEEEALKEKGKELGKHLTTFKVEWEE